MIEVDAADAGAAEGAQRPFAQPIVAPTPSRNNLALGNSWIPRLAARSRVSSGQRAPRASILAHAHCSSALWAAHRISDPSAYIASMAASHRAFGRNQRRLRCSFLGSGRPRVATQRPPASSGRAEQCPRSPLQRQILIIRHATLSNNSRRRAVPASREIAGRARWALQCMRCVSRPSAACPALGPAHKNSICFCNSPSALSLPPASVASIDNAPIVVPSEPDAGVRQNHLCICGDFEHRIAAHRHIACGCLAANAQALARAISLYFPRLFEFP